MYNNLFKRVLLFTSIIISIISISNRSYAGNRIIGPTDRNGRCVDNIPDAPTCQGERDYGLRSGCINKEEYDSLVAYNSYPICDRNNILRAWCSCGCFEKNTRIFSVGKDINFMGYEKIEKIISEKQHYKVLSLHQDTKLSTIKSNTFDLFQTTSGPEKEALIVIYTENNLRLAVTKKHAILLSNGKMVEAEKVQLTDKLVQANGKPVSVLKIEREFTNDDVLNILTSGKTPIEHTLFAEGLIVGDLAWQNNLKSMLNSITVRE
ncbi:Hint domain-containing protein [Pigmentibacter ruber]